MLATSHHPNICELYQAMVHQQYLWLIMPQLEISVAELMEKCGPSGFDEQIIATIMYDILQAIAYLHANKQIHRDIKLSNFLLDMKGNSYLSDFGVAGMIKPFSNAVKSTFVGSPLYMAPEIATNKPYNNSCDIWSFGICLYHLATGTLPHANLQGMESLFKVIQGDAPRLPKQKNYSKPFREIVELCLQKDPNERWTAEKLMGHKFWSNRADKNKIIDMVKECIIQKGNKDQQFKDKVQQANSILQNKITTKQAEEWNFEDDDDDTTAAQKKEPQPQQQPKHISPQTIHCETQNSPNNSPFKKDNRRTSSESRVNNNTINNQPAQNTTAPVPAAEQNNYGDLMTNIQGLINELQQLRAENTKLKEENARYKDRLKLFMNTNQKDE